MMSHDHESYFGEGRNVTFLSKGEFGLFLILCSMGGYKKPIALNRIQRRLNNKRPEPLVDKGNLAGDIIGLCEKEIFTKLKGGYRLGLKVHNKNDPRAKGYDGLRINMSQDGNFHLS